MLVVSPQSTIVWICVAVFAATAAITLLALSGRLTLGGAGHEDHRKYLRWLFRALILEIVLVATTVFADSMKNTSEPPRGIVPPVETTKVPELAAGADADFELLRDVSVWDLRTWRPVARDKDQRISPVSYLNYLHVRKRRESSRYVAHYATSGAAIDLRCVTQAARVFERQTSGAHEGEREYSIEIDVASQPVQQEFLIIVEATYWNGFQGKEQDVSTYTDADVSRLGELAVLVLFPIDKPFQSYRLLSAITGQSETEYRAPTVLYQAPDRSYLYWNISSRQPSHHYKLSWIW